MARESTATISHCQLNTGRLSESNYSNHNNVQSYRMLFDTVAFRQAYNDHINYHGNQSFKAIWKRLLHDQR